MNLFRLFGSILICISIYSFSNNEATITNLDISTLEISNKLVSLNDYEFIKLDIDTSKKDISSFYLFNDTLVITQNH